MTEPEPTYATLRRACFQEWRRTTGGDGAPARAQGVVAELLAEHHLMSCVLEAMRKEIEHLKGGGALEVSFWSDLIDFIGNYVHQCHRPKEELHCFPELVEGGSLPANAAEDFGHEHARAKQLTWTLCAAVEEGDWEKTLAVGSLYLHFLLPHMEAEESHLVPQLAQGLPGELEGRLRERFDAVEAASLPATGRQHYLEVAQRLCRHAGASAVLEEEAPPGSP